MSSVNQLNKLILINKVVLDDIQTDMVNPFKVFIPLNVLNLVSLLFIKEN